MVLLNTEPTVDSFGSHLLIDDQLVGIIFSLCLLGGLVNLGGKLETNRSYDLSNTKNKQTKKVKAEFLKC